MVPRIYALVRAIEDPAEWFDFEVNGEFLVAAEEKEIEGDITFKATMYGPINIKSFNLIDCEGYRFGERPTFAEALLGDQVTLIYRLSCT